MNPREEISREGWQVTTVENNTVDGLKMLRTKGRAIGYEGKKISGDF